MLRRILRTASIIAIIVFFVWTWFGPRGGPTEGVRAPILVGTLLNGGEFDLDEAAGSVTILDFWATWCGPCIRSLPALQILHERYADDPTVRILSVNIDDGAKLKKRIGAFMAERNYDFPVIMDFDKRISRTYRVQTIPTMVVVDPDGIVHKVKVGLLASDPERIVKHVVTIIAAAR